MKSRLIFVCVVVVALTFVMTWAVTAQPSQPPMPYHPMEAHVAASSPDLAIPDWNNLKPFRPPFDLSAPTAPKALTTSGQPGLSFRYVQTFGTPETPYLADTAHLNFPWGLATDGTNVLIGEYWGHRVLKYTSTGGHVSTIGTVANFNDGALGGVFDMAVDGSGQTWIVDNDWGQVLKFDAANTYLEKFNEGLFSNPAGIAFDGAGNVYISDGATFWSDDVGNQRVLVFDSTGNLLSTIGTTGETGTDNNHFHGPQHIAIYGTQLYVGDGGNHRVQIFNISTPTAPVYAATIGVTGESGWDNAHFDHPVGVAVDASYIYVADRWNHRVQIFSRTTRAYVATIGTGYGTGNDQFNNPTDVAVDSTGNIYVADFANCRVQQFNSSFIFQRTYGTTGVPYLTDGYHYNTPSGVAVAADGNIYLTEDNGHRLIKLSAAGIPQWTVGVAGSKGDFFEATNDRLNNPADIAFNAAGQVYVADRWHSRVQVFNPDGTYAATIGGGTGNYEFSCPTGLTIDKNGYIYVTDCWRHRVQIFNAHHVYMATLGETDIAGSDNAHFNNPQGVAVDSHGFIYVADSDNYRVQVFNASRVYVRTMGVTGVSGSGFDLFGYPTRLAVDSSDRVYVSDSGNDRVQVFDSTGVYLTTLGGSWGNQSGSLRNPQGVAVDQNGAVYVADSQNHRIQKYVPGVPGWTQTNVNGFGDISNYFISTLSSFGGQLYAGTYSWSGNGAQLWRANDGLAWTPVMTNGFGITRNVGIDHLFSFNGQMYAGTWADEVNGGEVWRSGNGVDWTRVVSQGFGNPSNGEIYRFAVFSNTLYASTWSYTTTHGLEIWRSSTGNSGDWTRVISNGFNGNVGNLGATAMAVFDGYLYAGTYNWNSTTITTTGGEVWRTNDGTTWLQVNTSGFGTVRNGAVTALAAFDGYLYAATYSQIWRCQVCDNSDWAMVVNKSFGGMNALAVFDNRLYFVVANSVTGVEVWRTASGTSWEQVGSAGFGDSNNARTYWDNAVTVFNNRLYIGTGNGANGGEIWKKTVTADFTANRTLGLPALDVTFTNVSAGDYTTSLWDFGDGVTSTLTNPTHTYGVIGTYTVTLTVSDGIDVNALTRARYIRVARLVFLPLVRR